MPYHLEKYGNKGMVANSATGKHYSKMPISMVNAKRQIRLLRAKENEKAPKRAKPMEG